MTTRPAPFLRAIALVTTAQLAVAAIVALFGTDGPVPMHFNIAGDVDRWGDRSELALVIGLMALISAGAGGSLAWSARSADDARRRGLSWAIGITLATTTLMTAMFAWIGGAGAGAAGETPRVTLMFVCLLLAGIGAVMGKVPPNALVGLRTPWSLNSRLAWEKSNRLAGRLFFWGGLAGLLIAPLLPVEIGHVALTVAVLSAAALSVFESWRVWRADPERRVV